MPLRNDMRPRCGPRVEDGLALDEGLPSEIERKVLAFLYASDKDETGARDLGISSAPTAGTSRPSCSAWTPPTASRPPSSPATAADSGSILHGEGRGADTASRHAPGWDLLPPRRSNALNTATATTATTPSATPATVRVAPSKTVSATPSATASSANNAAPGTVFRLGT
jgi:hypothetical protein